MEFTGKTIENAIENAVKELGVKKEDLKVTVIEEGNKGVLGIGAKKARINVETKQDDGKRAADFLDGLFNILKINAATELKEEDETIYINLISATSSSLIGYRGEMLDAFQTLAGAVANIGNEEYKRVVVDCENYREKRQETLKALAERLANKAVKLGMKVTLEPMNPYERRVIHSALSDYEGVKTESQGAEPNRYVVIIPDNLKPYEKRNRSDRYERRDNRNGRGKDDRRGRSSGFKSEMIKSNKKTSGFGTYLGNSLKND